MWKSPTRANHNMKKRGLCFICSVFVVKVEIKVTLLMPSFCSILFRLFPFSIEDFLVLMMIVFVEFHGNVSNCLVILLNLYAS
jgi:hypothetical protein